MNTAFFDHAANPGDGVAVVNGDDIGAHDFGDGFVALHLFDWVGLDSRQEESQHESTLELRAVLGSPRIAQVWARIDGSQGVTSMTLLF